MNLQQLRDSGWIIYECLTGSHAYGTNVEGSDKDYRGVFIQPTRTLLGTQYFPQIGDEKNDTTFYEIGNFIQLLAKGNPNMLELLNMPEECVVSKDEIWDKVFTAEVKEKFITTKLKHTFTGYAYAQIKKANSLDKMMNWEQTRVERKDVLDFCYVLTRGSDSVLFKHWIKHNPKVHIGGLIMKDCEEKTIGLANVNNFPDMYAAYYLESGGGIVSESSNDVQLRSIPQNAPFLFYLRFNKTAYSQHCRDYKQYQDWLKARNVQRYVDIEGHGQRDEKTGSKIDCYLDSATEYLTDTGWKKYDNISKSDKLATIDSERNLIFQNFTERFKVLYTGEIWTFENRYTRFSVTPNHNLYFSDVHRNIYNGYDASYVEDKSNWHFETVEDYMSGKRSWKHYVSSLNNQRKPTINLSTEELIIIGAYISDGTLTENAIVIDQCESKPLTSVIRGLKTISFTETRYWKKERKKYYNRFRINNKKLFNIAEQIGHGSFVKRLPSYFINLSKHQVDSLFLGCMMGDGHFHKKGHRIYYSSNYSLIVDIQTLLFCNGYNTQIYTVNHKGGFEGSAKEKYQVYVSNKNDHIGCLNKSIRSAFKKDNIIKRPNWTKSPVKEEAITCFSVPNRILITRNRNKISVQGNSKNLLHTVRLLNMSKDIAEGKGIVVRRPEAEYLKDIRKGKYNLQEIIDSADSIIEDIGKSFDNSGLPHEVSSKFINELITNIRIDNYEQRG